VAYENNNERSNETIYSQRLKAGKKRTYFFDVKATKGNDYFITLTESKKRFDDGGYDRHKIFIYKEDFNKFLKAFTETVDHVKTVLMPDFDFDAFNHENQEPYEGNAHHEVSVLEENVSPSSIEPQFTQNESQTNFDLGSTEVDKW
jgi:hypothetical protein